MDSVVAPMADDHDKEAEWRVEFGIAPSAPPTPLTAPGTPDVAPIVCEEIGAPMLEASIDPSANSANLLKRKLFPGAAESDRMYDGMEDRLNQTMQRLRRTSRRVKPSSENVVFVARRLSKFVQSTYPAWGDEMRRLATAALVVYNLRRTDVSTPELVQVVWVCLGDVRLRSHNGVLYFHDTVNGVWRAFSGILPEGIFVFLRDFTVKLEGLFRSFTGIVPLTPHGVLDAIKDALLTVQRGTASERQEKIIARFVRNSFFNKGDKPRALDVPAVEPDAGAGGVADAENESENDREGAAEPDSAESAASTWYFNSARLCRALTPRLTRELLKTGEVIKGLIEWCESPNPRVEGIVYLDRAFRYLDPPDLLEIVEQPGPNSNFYLFFPSALFESDKTDDFSETEGPDKPLEDPYLKAAQTDVLLFLRQTFWANYEGLKCCQAALALSKRYLNIVQAFIFHALGGCGLSLFTEIIANSLGEDNHKYFDPAVFFEDEEMRKMVELLANGICFSGQERPQGSKKKMLLHLWKKFLSGEGLRGRMPYAVLTRMIRLIGWVRLEVNSVMEMEGVREEEFESMLRRSCVIKIYARLFDKDYLDKHLPDHESVGIFARKPHLSSAFQTPPYAAAFNRIQHSFEEQFSKDDCYSMITNFTRNGGDGGATEAYMRAATGLPTPKSRTAQLGKNSALASIDTDAQKTIAAMASGEATDAFSLNLAVELLRELKMDTLTYTYFNQKARKVPGLTISRSEMYKRLPASKFFTDHSVSGKQKSAIIPHIPTRYQLKDILGNCRDLEKSICLPESWDGAATESVFGPASIIGLNMSLLKESLGAILITKVPNRGRVRGRGRGRGGSTKNVKDEPDSVIKEEHADEGEVANEHAAASSSLSSLSLTAGNRCSLYKMLEDELRVKLGKINHVIEEARACIVHATSSIDVDGSSKITRISKKRQEMLTPSPQVTTHADSVRDRTVMYEQCRNWRSRDIAISRHALQRTSQWLQTVATPHTIDVDCVNNWFVVTNHLVTLLEITPAVRTAFAVEIATLSELSTSRDKICLEKLNVSIPVGKDILLKLAGGSAISSLRTPESDDAIAFLEKVVDMSRFLRWLAISTMETEFKQLRDDPTVKWPEGSCLAHFYQSGEAYILRILVDFTREKPIKHVTLAFDGMRVDADRVIAENDESTIGEPSVGRDGIFLMLATDRIHSDKLGFPTALKVKDHFTLVQSIVQLETGVSFPLDDAFRIRGLSPLLAVASLFHGDAEVLAHLTSLAKDLFSGDSQVEAVNSIRYTLDLVRFGGVVVYIGVEAAVVGKTLLLCSHHNQPVCIGVDYFADNTVKVYYQAQCYSMTRMDFNGLAAKAIDRHVMVMFVLMVASAGVKDYEALPEKYNGVSCKDAFEKLKDLRST
jgi:hypothetical protein